MIIRELLTVLGIDFDPKGADQAEKRIGQLQNALETVGTILTFGGVFKGVQGVVEMASDAEQTLSKLRLNFEENTQSVLDWAQATADATGASKYDLREFAGTFGSMLVPTMNFDRAKAAEMSKTLSSLALDLAAINNEKPEETMGRLFSGMTGSSEAVERLGINIKALALQEYARTLGITKSVTKMSVREKAELIYGKMLLDTKDKIGAAGKEADSYAGRLLRLSAAVKDAGTSLGQKLIPYASDFVSLLTRGAGLLGDWAGDTNKVAAAFVTLGSILAAMGVRMIIANLPLIGFALGLALIYLAVNDLITAFSGGKSAIGTFMEYLIGDKAWERISQLPNKLGDLMFELGLSDKQKADRGLDNKGSVGNRFMRLAFGHEPTEADRKMQTTFERRQSVMGAAESGRTDARRGSDNLGGGWFDLLDHSKQSLNQTMRPYLTAQPRQQFGRDGAINMTFHIAGNADSQTVAEMKEATRQVLVEERQRMLETTSTDYVDGFEDNSVADEEHISSGVQ